MDDQPPPPYSLNDPSPLSQHPIATSSTSTTANAIPYVSGAAYFEMRPPARPRPSNILPCHIAVLPNATTADLPMPEPKQILADRDVEAHDWTTFVNHLVPYESANPSVRNNGKAIREKAEAVRTQNEKSSMVPPVEEAERQRRVKASVEEWNQGFFLPRGLQVIVKVDVTPRPQQPAADRTSSFLQSTTNRPSPPDSVPSETRSPKEDISALQAQARSKGKRNTDKDLGMALYRAVGKQDTGTCEALLQAGADPNARPSWEPPAIVEAVKKGNMQILRMLLEYGPDLDASSSGDGTALYNAVSKSKTDMVKILLKHGANPNKRPTGSDPALYKAFSKQYDEIVELLLQYDLNIEDTPPGGTTTLYAAAKKGNVELVKRLLALGAKPDARPVGNDTAMFEAAKKGHCEVCRILLANGAEVDAKTYGGNTALYNIVGKKDDSLVRLLLDHGADIHARAWGGESVLERAVNKGYKDVVPLLLQYNKKK